MDNLLDYNHPTQRLQYGSFGARWVALILDAFIFGIIEWLAAKFVGHKISTTLSVCLYIGYHVVMETSERQATWGKVAMGLKVTDNNGAPISAFTSFLRCVMSYLSALLLFAGYWIALFTDRTRTFHDIIAGTIVVKA